MTNTLAKERVLKIWTVGYQKLTVADLLTLLKQNQIDVLVDVRSRPFGRKHEFNQKALQIALAEADIEYIWRGKDLGGLSGSREVGYTAGLIWLHEEAQLRKVCIMCMEDDPDTCHRKQWISADLEKTYRLPSVHLRAANLLMSAQVKEELDKLAHKKDPQTRLM